MLRILFVCHGNICRSPMAECILKDMVKKRGWEQAFRIRSCATSAEEIVDGRGNPVYPPARRELLRHGIDPGGKRAVQLTRADYDSYDHLIGMDARNLRAMDRILGGDPACKISLLLAFTGENRDVDDPWYTGDFAAAYEDIARGCGALLNRLIQTGRV